MVRHPNNQEADEIIQKLCTACGLCCNGALFADVKLQRGEDPKQMSALGLKIEKIGRSSFCLQPCSALRGSRCSVYEKRPKYCRAFECGLLQRVLVGEMSVRSGQRTINDARVRVAQINCLLVELKENDESVPLTQRYRQIMSEPWDLSGNKRTLALRSKLFLSMQKLAQFLDRNFLS